MGGRTKTVEAPGGYRFDIGRPSSSIPRSWPTSSRPAASGWRITSSSSVSTRSTTSSSRRVARFAPPPTWSGWRPRSRASRRTTRRTCASSSPTTGQAEVLQAGAGAGLPHPARHGLARDDRRLAPPASGPQRGQGSQALLQGSARPPRLRVPDQVPRHVAVPVPQSVHHPVVPRIRARGLPPGGRLRRCLGGDGGAGPPHGRRHPSGRGRRAGAVRGQARQRRDLQRRDDPRRRRGDQWRFRQGHPRAGAPAAPPALARRQDREGPPLLLDLHALSRPRRPMPEALGHHTILLSEDYARNIPGDHRRHPADAALSLRAACGLHRRRHGAPRPDQPLRAGAGAEPEGRDRLEGSARDLSPPRPRPPQAARPRRHRIAHPLRAHRRPHRVARRVLRARGRDLQPRPRPHADALLPAPQPLRAGASTSSAAAPIRVRACR